MNIEANKANREVIIIGGGPAGLTAAYELTRHQIQPVVLEKLDKVGGIARTENYKGYHFDMGGHRFFTKSAEVNAFWHEILAEDFLHRPRLSRIYYKNKYFNYPLKPINALRGLGIIEGFQIGASYLRWHLFPYKEEDTFEQWVTNRFGKRLFETFFKSYTEKVWGIPCSELKAEWAAQRIKDLSLKTALTTMFLKPGKTIKTLIESFDYPRRGPGMLWTAVKDRVIEHGGAVHLNQNVVGINRDGFQITSVEVETDTGTETIKGTDFISSMPINVFLQNLNPPPPAPVVHAAKNLKHRDFLTVCLILDKPDLFPDNWIYVHDPNVQVGRIQNYKNWSPDMLPNQAHTSLGLEYFCNEGDETWNMSDAELIELGKREIAQIGIANSDDIIDGCVFRVEKTYPVYDGDYAQYLETIKAYVAQFENFQTIGRNGLHRYNNQDHAMLTGMLAVRNMLDGEANNLWQVNAEQEYHETIVSEEDAVVKKHKQKSMPPIIGQTLSIVDDAALGLSLGFIAALLTYLLTLFLV